MRNLAEGVTARPRRQVKVGRRNRRVRKSRLRDGGMGVGGRHREEREEKGEEQEAEREKDRIRKNFFSVFQSLVFATSGNT